MTLRNKRNGVKDTRITKWEKFSTRTWRVCQYHKKEPGKHYYYCTYAEYKYSERWKKKKTNLALDLVRDGLQRASPQREERKKFFFLFLRLLDNGPPPTCSCYKKMVVCATDRSADKIPSISICWVWCNPPHPSVLTYIHKHLRAKCCCSSLPDWVNRVARDIGQIVVFPLLFIFFFKERTLVCARV